MSGKLVLSVTHIAWSCPGATIASIGNGKGFARRLQGTATGNGVRTSTVTVDGHGHRTVLEVEMNIKMQIRVAPVLLATRLISHVCRGGTIN